MASQKRYIFADLFGGQFLVRNGWLIRNWTFVLYIFFLIILLISFRYNYKDTLLKEGRNNTEIDNLKAEYLGKNAQLLEKSKRGEIEKKLKEHNSSLIMPDVPPIIIKMD